MNLKPCPFCGKDRAEYKSSGAAGHRASLWIECEYCHARGPRLEADRQIEAPALAAEEWNRRAEEVKP